MDRDRISEGLLSSVHVVRDILPALGARRVSGRDHTMRFPLHVTTGTVAHQIRNGLRGRSRYPFVLMLEPLYTCNLACIGCATERHTGKLADRVPLERCFDAVEKSEAPIVSICGGEPTNYPELPWL